MKDTYQDADQETEETRSPQDTDQETEETRSPQRRFDFSLLTGDGSLVRLFLIVLGIFIAFSLAVPSTFPTTQNMWSMAFQASEIGLLTIAVALPMLTGGIDLSINSTANFAGILAGLVLTHYLPADATGVQLAFGIALAIGAGLAWGVVGGLINGTLVAYVGITPILATLGTLTLYDGIATGITGGATTFGNPTFQYIGNGYFLGLPVPLVILIAAAVIVALILNKTTFGIRIYMLGTNPTAARYSGINNKRILLKTYMMSGVLSAIAGIVILGRTNSANVDFGGSYVLQAILMAVLGGVDPYGGSGRVAGLVMAVAALQFLSTGLNMLLFQYSGSNFFKEFAWGALLLLVLVVNYFSNKRRARTASQ